jgi:hypothetical protein
VPLETCKTVDQICMNSKSRASPVCTDMDFTAITKIVYPNPRTEDEINLEEEDVVAYLQLMDDIDVVTGNTTLENNSFLT